MHYLKRRHKHLKYIKNVFRYWLLIKTYQYFIGLEIFLRLKTCFNRVYFFRVFET